MPHLKKVSNEVLIDSYNSGLSTVVIGRKYGMSRQAVWERLKQNDVQFRTKKLLPVIIYDGIKFTKSKDRTYYRNTDRTSRKANLVLHRYVFEKEAGKIPENWDVHHIDMNPNNNDIMNLIALPKDVHTSLHQEIKIWN